jgi:hypothetical protein
MSEYSLQRTRDRCLTQNRATETRTRVAVQRILAVVHVFSEMIKGYMVLPRHLTLSIITYYSILSGTLH